MIWCCKEGLEQQWITKKNFEHYVCVETTFLFIKKVPKPPFNCMLNKYYKVQHTSFPWSPSLWSMTHVNAAHDSSILINPEREKHSIIPSPPAPMMTRFWKNRLLAQSVLVTLPIFPIILIHKTSCLVVNDCVVPIGCYLNALRDIELIRRKISYNMASIIVIITR